MGRKFIRSKKDQDKHFIKRTGFITGLAAIGLAACLAFAGGNMVSFAADDGLQDEETTLEEVLVTTDDPLQISSTVLEKWDEKSAASLMNNKFGLKRIMVLTDGEELDETYGADKIIYYKEYDEYILQFDTTAETREAYYELVVDFGEDNCFVDRVVEAKVPEQEKRSLKSTYYATSWGAGFMGLDVLKESYGDYTGISKVNVAVIDSGCDTTNSIFKGRIDTKHSFYFYGDSSISKYTNFNDGFGHGTHVAGTIADCTPSNVSLQILKVFDSNGRASDLGIRTALQYAVSKSGADVVNMSLGWTGADIGEMTYLDDVIEKAKKKGVVICVSAGNDATDCTNDQTGSYPANNKDVVTVSAINYSGTFDYSYSNYGSTIDFCAPGTDVTAAYIGGGTYMMTGTSMAAPHISSAAAYVKMIYPTYTMSQVVSTLKKYAYNPYGSGWNKYYGYGYLKMSKLFKDSGLICPADDYYSNGTLKPAAKTYFTKKTVNREYGAKAYTYKVKSNSTGKAIYKSSNTSIATVSASGKVTIKKKGTVKITATVQADSNHRSSTASYTLVVAPKNIKGYYAELSAKRCKYTGKACKPDMFIDDLTEGVEYKVYYKNNVKIGTGIVVAKGRGNYTGRIELHFKIVPGKVTISKIGNRKSGMYMSWKKVKGATAYEIYRKAGNGSYKKIATVKSNKLSYTDKKAKNKVTYTYKIRAKKGSYYGSFSKAKKVVRKK